jgi:hypothetical protein
MSTAIVVIVIVIALLAGITISLLSSARTGMPPKEVLERAARRSRELHAGEKPEQSERGD